MKQTRSPVSKESLRAVDIAMGETAPEIVNSPGIGGIHMPTWARYVVNPGTVGTALLVSGSIFYGCKKECNLKPKEGYNIVETTDKNGKPYCFYDPIKEEPQPDTSCPFGCDHHKDSCKYFVHTPTTYHTVNGIAYLDACSPISDTSKVAEPNACPFGCTNHTKERCHEFNHEPRTMYFNGRPVVIPACFELKDTVYFNAPDTVDIDILNFADLGQKISIINKNTMNGKISKVYILNPLVVTAGDFSVLRVFDQTINDPSNKGKVIVDWMGRFVCPATNGIMLTYAEWEAWGKPKLGINPANGAKFNIAVNEKNLFPDVSIFNIVIPPMEL
ncbi:MAG: hypothetical protein FWE50_04525, partial [Alphaproteobacteria bacterium]|nr:hypothetical protein [Alphaproteobacteria bacterium]